MVHLILPAHRCDLNSTSVSAKNSEKRTVGKNSDRFTVCLKDNDENMMMMMMMMMMW